MSLNSLLIVGGLLPYRYDFVSARACTELQHGSRPQLPFGLRFYPRVVEFGAMPRLEVGHVHTSGGINSDHLRMHNSRCIRRRHGRFDRMI